MIKRILHRYLLEPIRQQLVQGISPKGLALTCAVGIGAGSFPVIGATTVLCLIAGMILKLNQPILQVVNYLMYPLQILLIPVFVHFGCIFTHSPLVSVNPIEMTREFSLDPAAFLGKYLWVGLHAILAWAILIPGVVLLVYLIAWMVLKRGLKKGAV